MKNKKQIAKIVIALIVVAAAGGGGYFAYSQYTANKARAAMQEVFAANTPTISRAVTSDFKNYITATGVVYLKDEESVYSPAEAKLLEVLVDVDGYVEEGQEIVTYNVADSRATLEKKISEAEISLNNQMLSLTSMKLLPTEAEIDQLNSNIENAEKSIYDANTTIEGTRVKIATQEKEITRCEEEIVKAQQTIDTNAQLLAVDAITQDAYDQSVEAKATAERQYETQVNTLNDLNRTLESNIKNLSTAESNLKSAQKKLADSGNVLSTEADKIKYQQQENQVKLSQLNLEDLRRQLSELVSSATSPISGKITSVPVARGANVTKDSVLITVADFNQLIVKASISEYDIANIELGQQVTMTSDGIPNSTYKGTVISIGSSAKSQSAVSGTETVIPIEISVDNVDKYIKPGFNLDLEILTVDKASVLNIPASAILKDRETGSRYVYGLDENRLLKKIEITTGLQSDLQVEVLTGLSEGDIILDTPSDTMREGMSLDSLGGMGIRGGGAGGRSNQNGQSGQMLFPGNGGSARPAGTVTFSRP